MTMCQLRPILFSDDHRKLIDYLKVKVLFYHSRTATISTLVLFIYLFSSF